MKKQLNRFGEIILGISIVILFNGTIAFSQINLASPFPDRVILNLSEDASTSLAVTWRTDNTISEGYCELQSTPDGRIDPSISKTLSPLRKAYCIIK
jgi:hypothetical protein